MLWVSLILALFTIWTIRLASPSAASLFEQFGGYFGVEGPHRTTASNATALHTTDAALYLAGERATDPATADIDISDADAPFIIWPLKRVCAEQTQWVEGLIFVCDNNFGGVGNIRTFILTCIRYAIDAGATGMTMPRIRKRGDNIGSLFEHDIRPLDYLFDAQHFRGALARSCPQITLYKDDYSDIPNTANILDIPRTNFVIDKGPKEIEEDSIDVTEPVPVHVIVPKNFRCHNRVHVTAGYSNRNKRDDEATGVRVEKVPDEGAQETAAEQTEEETEKESEQSDDLGDGDCGEFHHHAERWGDNFRHWLFNESRIEQSGVPAPSAETPFLVRMGKWVLFQYPTEKDGPEFRNTFGQLLKFDRPVMDMGKKVLGKMQNMSATLHAQRLSAGLAEVPPRQNKTTVINNDERGFLGLHLRTESDVTEAGWPSYDELEDGFLAKATQHGFQGGVAYVATGNVEDARRFEAEAREAIDLKVVDKRILLADEPQALAELEALNWDQQGLVDFVVMAGSEMFVGSSRSSFSIWLCVRRAVTVDGGIHARPFRPRVEQDDGASFVVGPKELYWNDWLFFYDATWP